MNDQKFLIEEFSSRGFGVGYVTCPNTSNLVKVEVAHTVLGDLILAQVGKKRKGIRKGRLLKIVKPSKERTHPKCSHSEICGGCCWQSVAYKTQLEQKEKRVLEAFDKMINQAQVLVYPIIACSFPWLYRNKMEFSFSENGAQTKFLGLMIAHARSFVFNLKECHLVNSWFANLVQVIRSWWEKSDLKAFDFKKGKGHLKNLILREGVFSKEKMVILTVHELSDDWTQSFVQTINDFFAPEKVSVYLRVQKAQKGTPTLLLEKHLAGPLFITEKLNLDKKPKIFKIGPSSFFQPNSMQAEKLFNRALSMVNLPKEAIVYDLYCGTGSFAIAVSSRAHLVIGIELNAQAISDARANASFNQISNIHFYEGDVGEVLSQENLPAPDLVILDPPRAGLGKNALRMLAKLRPKAILYVSCNPLTQAENIAILLKENYKLKKLQPIDQFPHTYHIENIAYLEL